MMAGSFTTLSLSPAPMSDKSTTPPDAFFAIPGHRVLAMEGRDALKFAQAQFTTDVQALEDGHWQWSGWLTPKGRVIALFALLRLGPEQLWLVLPDADPAALAEQLAGRWTDDPADLQATPGGRVLRLRQPLSPESATEVRRRIAAGEPWQAMVPPAVAARITTDGLYAHGADGGAPL